MARLRVGRRQCGLLSQYTPPCCGRIPGELLDFTTTEQELQGIVLGRYLDRTFADQSEYNPPDAHRYLGWIARFLSGEEVSPFGLKTSDFTVFELADLTPPDPPLRYRLLGLILGLVYGLVYGLAFGLVFGLALAPSNGGWFVLLQRVAHRRLARAGNLPLRPYDFLEWGLERRILRRVGGGVRFRHSLIQQHLASADRRVEAGEKVIS